MKRTFSFFRVLLLAVLLAIPAAAAPEAPQITLQPQNLQYPEYSTAGYLVKASGTNLTCTWYLEYQGKTYNISDNSNGIEPWEGYAGETYGAAQPDSNSFFWFFGGIEEALNGAQIWCVIEDGHYTVESQHATVTVQGNAMPPEILAFPAALTAKQGQSAEVRCTAKAPGACQLEYLWYETATGKLPDIRALEPAENSDFLILDTAKAGTRYYVCAITTSDGGRAYSSVLPVTVTEAAPEPTTAQTPTVEAAAPAETTTAPTEATAAPTETTAAPTEATAAPTEATAAPTETTAAVDTPKDTTQTEPAEAPNAFPWWGFVLIALGGSGAGAGLAVLLLKKKKS